MATQTKPHNQILFEHLEDGPASAAELKRALKMDDDEFATFTATAKARLWVTEDDSGKTTKYELTEMGRRVHATRYPADTPASE